MLPLIARSSQEVLLLVPGSLREAADALGVDRWRTVARRDPAGRDRRDRHRRDPGDRPRRRRDRAAAVLRLDLQPERNAAQPVPRRPERPDVHLHVLRPAAAQAVTRAWGAALRADDASSCWPTSAPACSSPAAVRRWADDRLGPDGRSQITPRRGRSTGRVRIRTEPRASGHHRTAAGNGGAAPQTTPWCSTSATWRSTTGATARWPDHAEDLPQPGDRGDRPVGLRQVDVHPQPQPDERLDPRLQARGPGPLPRPRRVRHRANRVEVRRRIGMVFQKPNPFPKSIYDNVAWAAAEPRHEGSASTSASSARCARRRCGTRSRTACSDSALGLSGGQQQRLCIARAIAIEPDVLLLDEPASALDPIATASIEDLMHTLKHRFTIVIVTHNMQQAARVADRTAFFSLDHRPERVGTLIEYDDTETIFRSPPTRARATTSRASSADRRDGRRRRRLAEDRVARTCWSIGWPHCQQYAAPRCAAPRTRRTPRRSRSAPAAGSARPRRARRPRSGAAPPA